MRRKAAAAAAATFLAPDSLPAESCQEKECTVLICNGMEFQEEENKF